MDYGDTNLTESKKSGKKPVYAISDLRDIADLYAQLLLDRASKTGDDDDEEYGAVGNIDLIEKYSPSRAAQLRARQVRSNSTGNSAANVKEMRIATASNTSGPSTGVGTASANANSPASEYEMAKRVRAEREKSR